MNLALSGTANHSTAAAIALLACALVALTGCGPTNGEAPQDRVSGGELDVDVLRQVLEMQGTVQNGRFKVTVPQNDLDVTVEGVSIVPPMGMGSWATFAPAGDETIVMGDIVLREEEVAAVEEVLVDHPVHPTALHKHFLRESPRVVYMHIGGTGSEEALAAGVRAALDRIAELRGGNPAEAEAQRVENTLDTDRIASILGYEGSMSRGVYKVTIPRPDVGVSNHGQPVTAFMGLSTWASWQGTPKQAAVAGDFAMTAGEVSGVIEALGDHGIEVVALHNHMLEESPQIYFLHYWGRGPAQKLAEGLRAALDQTGAGEG